MVIFYWNLYPLQKLARFIVTIGTKNIRTKNISKNHVTVIMLNLTRYRLE